MLDTAWWQLLPEGLLLGVVGLEDLEVSLKFFHSLLKKDMVVVFDFHTTGR